ncbi:hypothetical protein CFC21_001070 [Triticum aestivum]|uniref:Heparan-alpha-glucosaminide N-acetyltransferase catalytic domain-containing protein n=1 Tax=Triticum aestivum TaxID=4565 RepID=A0A3B5XVW4_WHEAT|nr:heparan-alpha-glucosaminide N-acetyltransferase-like isoform X2 [Triticum aestivum]KAF6982724.1 hypothetical protein CFC21_001070 [Triticum aestivum]
MDATVVAVASDGDEGDDRRHLLETGSEILPYPESPWRPQPPGADAKPEQQKPQRVASLDVFRGLTVAMMILVDDAGGAWPGINHAPWFGVTVADFVMPAFLFIIGVSAALVFKKTPNKIATSKKAACRAIKLFILGVILQGGYIHGRHKLTYGIDLDHIRWLGVLQRIAIGYFLAAISEIWLVNNTSVDSPVSFVKKYFVEWIMAIVISALYIGLVFGLYVPNWEFKVQTSSSTFSNPTNDIGFKTTHSQRMMSWLLASTVLTVSGFLLQLLGMPFSKPLYTVSYMLLAGGVSGFLLLLLYCIVDVIHIKKPLILFQWLGMNALIVYVLAACELFPTFIQGFYWRSPENNLVDATESLLQAIFHSKRWGTLAFVLVEIIFWCLAACFLHMKGIYLKL